MERGRIETGNNAGDGVMDRNAFRKQTLALKPIEMPVTELFNVFSALAARDHGTDCEKEDIEERIANFGGLARVIKLAKVFDKAVDLHADTPLKGSIRSRPDLIVKPILSDHHWSKNIRDLALDLTHLGVVAPQA